MEPTWSSDADCVEIDPKHRKHGSQCLHLLGGEKRSVDVRFPKPIAGGSLLKFSAERWTSRAPFKFTIYSEDSTGKWNEIYDGTNHVRVGRSFLSQVNLSLLKKTSALRFVSTSPKNSGLLIDSLQIVAASPMALGTIETRQSVHPALIGKPENPVLDIAVNVTGQIGNAPKVQALRVSTTGSDNLDDIVHVRTLVNSKPVGDPMTPKASPELVFDPQSSKAGRESHPGELSPKTISKPGPLGRCLM